jgi:wyosine [tRNA(Phe)-imidazoG37] synthetase (radical SAM superfamily)
MTAGFKHVYGPVPSRRLGRSLGIDLVPYKTCTYDCVYCHLGRTTNKTVERKEYVVVDDVLEELERKLSAVPAPDYISLAGSGEPTLNLRIGDLIGSIKDLTRISRRRPYKWIALVDAGSQGGCNNERRDRGTVSKQGDSLYCF